MTRTRIVHRIARLAGASLVVAGLVAGIAAPAAHAATLNPAVILAVRAAKPNGVTVTLSVTWQDTSDGESWFQVLAAPVPSGDTVPNGTPALGRAVPAIAGTGGTGAVTFTDVQKNTRYCVRVDTMGAGGESVSSAGQCVRTPGGSGK